MVKRKMNLAELLSMAHHHVEPHKIELLSRPSVMSPDGAAINAGDARVQFKQAERKVKAAILVLERVQRAAQKANCKEVLEILNEEVEY